MYSEVEHPEIIPNKQSTNHNSPLDRIHGRMVSNMGNQQINLQ